MESHTFSKKYLSKSVDGLLSNTFSICRTIPTDKIDAYQLGFQLFGPMMYEFCRWIHEYNNGETSLLFLSREGEFIKQCYDLMYPENASIIVYLSRQSILQCMAYMMFCKYSVEEFREAIYLVNYEKISGVLRRIGLDVEQYKSLLESCGLTAEDRFDKRIDIFFQRNKSKILEELKEKFNPISVEYLNQCLTKGDTLVDIGWRGSMQKLLQRFVDLQGKNISLMGLYLGIDDTDHKAGFLYQDKGKNRQNIRCFSQLLEVITTPNHGSTIGYRKTAGGIMPVFAPNEFGDESAQTISELQHGIFDLIQHGVALHLAPNYHRDYIIRNLVRFGCHPSRKALQLFGSLEYFEAGKVYRLIDNTSLLHPRKMYSSFCQTRWKTGFLKSVFKLDFPYNWFVNFLRKAVLERK